MAQQHKYSITEIENLFPYERDIYHGLLEDYLKNKSEGE